MRQTHTPGERLFIDYAGQTVGVTDRSSGEIRPAQVFVAVLGASNYTYIEATWSQQLPDWIGSHVRALAFFGGCTELWVPDNLRSGVTKASRYEPDVNPTYHDLAEHYGVAVLPARARRPKDKAKVENGVLVVTRRVLARLRHQRFLQPQRTEPVDACTADRPEPAALQEAARQPGKRLRTGHRARRRPLPETAQAIGQYRRACN